MAEASTAESITLDEKDGNKDTKENHTEVNSANLTDEAQAEATADISQGKKSSKKKKKAKKSDEDRPSSSSAPAELASAEAQPAAVNATAIRQIQKAMEQLMATDKPARTRLEARQRKYEFWETQPVPNIGKASYCIVLYNLLNVSINNSHIH